MEDLINQEANYFIQYLSIKENQPLDFKVSVSAKNLVTAIMVSIPYISFEKEGSTKINKIEKNFEKL